MTQDWRRVDGPVTALESWGSTRRFDSIVEAVHFYARRFYGSPLMRHLLDQDGLYIPAWKIEEVARLNPLPSYRRWNRRFVYRQGPVEGIWNRRGRRCYRRVATSPERRENDFLFYDEEAVDSGVQVRGKRQRANLPSAWDDINHSRRGDGWKQYRKTQYR